MSFKWLHGDDPNDNWTSTADIPQSARHRDEHPSAGTAPKNIVAEGLTLKGILESGAVTSQAALAAKLGLTSARLSQKLQVVKLPKDIVEELSNTKDPAILRIFTERRIRSLLSLGTEKKIKTAFNELKLRRKRRS